VIEELIGHIHDDQDDGAILVFLPGMGEIASLLRRLQASRRFATCWTIPLHSSVSPADQRKAFRHPPQGTRKVVLATNIAETSLTIDDVVYVIDSGKLKERRHDPARGMSLLVEDWVSTASAAQRRGRAGRVREGVCYALYTKPRYERRMKPFQAPEMQRVPLEELVLQVRMLGVAPRASQFLARALQPPPAAAVEGAVRVLREVGALTETEALTPLGHHLAQLPMDVRLGKLLLVASCLGCLSPALSIAACLAHKSPFLSSLQQQSGADAARGALAASSSGTIAAGQQSDHLVMAAALGGWLDARTRGGVGAGGKFARRHSLSEQVLETLEEMRGQFAAMLADIGFLTRRSMGGHQTGVTRPRKSTTARSVDGHSWYDSSSLPANRYATHPAVLKAALLAALWPNIAVMDDQPGQSSAAKDESTTGSWHDGSGAVALHPSSLCASLSPQAFHRPFVAYLEKVRTSRVFLRDCTVISPASILLFGGQLDVDHAAGRVTVDGWIRIRASARTAALARQMRQGLDALLKRKVSVPEEDLRDGGGGALIEAIVKALDWEDAVAGWDR
jgi:ATP-dependent RNA helicase DHX29